MNVHVEAHAKFDTAVITGTRRHYRSLEGDVGLQFQTLLVRHQQIGQSLVGHARQVQWRLLDLDYYAVRALFQRLERNGQDYLTFLNERFEGGVFAGSTSFLSTDHGSSEGSFSEHFRDIHACSVQLSLMIGPVESIMDRAVSMNDYATANLLSELLFRTRQLINLIELNTPEGMNLRCSARIN